MATSHSDTSFLTITKSLPWRGERELFSNGYHLDVNPTSDSDWSALANFAWNLELAFFDQNVQLETATGHTPGTPPVLVWESDFGTVGPGGPPGTFVPGSQEHIAPGDCAMWVRWLTDKKTSRGKPIYFRNYYHQVFVEVDGNTISPTQHTALLNLASAWQTGIQANGKTFRRSGPLGGAPMNHAASIFATTRTLERRGRRKKRSSSSTSSELNDFLEKVAAGVVAKGLWELALAGA